MALVLKADWVLRPLQAGRLAVKQSPVARRDPQLTINKARSSNNREKVTNLDKILRFTGIYFEILKCVTLKKKRTQFFFFFVQIPDINYSTTTMILWKMFHKRFKFPGLLTQIPRRNVTRKQMSFFVVVTIPDDNLLISIYILCSRWERGPNNYT